MRRARDLPRVMRTRCGAGRDRDVVVHGQPTRTAGTYTISQVSNGGGSYGNGLNVSFVPVGQASVTRLPPEVWGWRSAPRSTRMPPRAVQTARTRVVWARRVAALRL